MVMAVTAGTLISVATASSRSHHEMLPYSSYVLSCAYDTHEALDKPFMSAVDAQQNVVSLSLLLVDINVLTAAPVLRYAINIVPRL